MPRRGVAPAVGVATMVLITVLLAALVGGVLFGTGLEDPPEAAMRGEAAYDATTGQTRIDLVHLAGDPLDVTRLTVRIDVDGTALDHQPSVPFFSATGFESGPTGPFNSGSADRNWRTGEKAGLAIAGSNDPVPTRGDAITVRLFVDGQPVAVVRTTVR